MVLLSLDTSSSRTGWGVFLNGKYIKSASIDLKKSGLKSEERMQKMCKEILMLIQEVNPDILVIEMTVVPRNAQAQRMLTMILGVVYGYCLCNDVYYQAVRPTEWRSWVEKGVKGKKEDLKLWSVNKVKELFGIDTNDDEADAVLIGVGYCNKFGK